MSLKHSSVPRHKNLTLLAHECCELFVREKSVIFDEPFISVGHGELTRLNIQGIKQIIVRLFARGSWSGKLVVV